MVSSTSIAVINFLKDFEQVDLKEYDFLCNIDVSEGDIVIVETVNGPRLGRVSHIKNESNIAWKWVVAKIDIPGVQERLNACFRRQKLESKLDERAFAIRYEMDSDLLHSKIAEVDEDMKNALERYEQYKKEISMKNRRILNRILNHFFETRLLEQEQKERQLRWKVVREREHYLHSGNRIECYKKLAAIDNEMKRLLDEYLCFLESDFDTPHG